MRPINDEQLVKLCKQGDRDAFDQLIGKYYLPLKKFFMKLNKNPAVCEDLTHDVILRLIRNIEKYRPLFGVKFSTWLFKMAYNVFLNHAQRHPGNRETPFEESIDPTWEHTGASDEFEQSLNRQYIEQMLDELPEELKTLMVLRYYSDFSYKEIGKITGLPPGKVKWKLHSALEKLKKAAWRTEGGVEA